MDLKLIRSQFRTDGIFGELRDENDQLVAMTLEHSYDSLPKIPEGNYKCVLGPHRLHGMTEDFITFEVTNVPGHQNILLHWGNWNRDSEGCILLGEKEADSNGMEMITNSRATFAKFMALEDGINEFQLVVSNPTVLK